MNPNDPGEASRIARRILQDVDAACVELYNDGPRRHLGASQIGHQCHRFLWYQFRWAHHHVHDGRMYRLFNRGHREEERYCEWLRKAGFVVFDRDPETGNQWRIEGVMGHFGGSLDGLGYLAPRYEYSPGVLYEFKTNGTGAGFNKLNEGVAIAKPQHFDQQCVYGYAKGPEYSVYLNINKNDDSIYPEFVKLDHKRGAELFKKAEVIILSQEPPNKAAQSPAALICKTCDMKGICHDGLPLDRNCRSCVFAQPIEDKQWRCNKHNGTIPEDFIPKGCGDWSPAA